MGARGPLAQSNHLRLVRGNPGKRLTKPTVKAKPEAPTAPTWLDREAKAEWKRIVPELDELGILAKVDRAVLAMYCVTWSRCVRLERKLRDHETVSSARDAKAIVKHPAWQVYRESVGLLKELAKEVGASPGARLRMTLPEGDASGQDDGGVLD